MAKGKEKDTVAAWLKNEGPARLHYPDELFPEMASAREQLRQRLAGDRAPAKPERQTQKRGWQLDRIEEVLPIVFPPDGLVPSDLTHNAVQGRLAPIYKNKRWRLPSTDTIRRARERQNSQ